MDSERLDICAECDISDKGNEYPCYYCRRAVQLTEQRMKQEADSSKGD